MALNPTFDPNRVRPGERVVVMDGLTLIRSARHYGTTFFTEQSMLVGLHRAQTAIHRHKAFLTTARHQRRNAARRHR